jgi:integrase/recombinase XerD
MKTSLKYEIGEHREKSVIFIRFAYNTKLVAQTRQLTGAKWSQSNTCWYVPDILEYRLRFGLPPKTIGKTALTKLGALNALEFKKYLETLQLKGYSPNTIRTYTNEFAQLLYILKEKSIVDCDEEIIRRYFLYCINELKLSENTLHSRVNAIKFYFYEILKKESFFITIPRPKKHAKLPKVIHAIDIRKIFEVTQNLKHNTMLKLSYGMGLRVSEIINLKITAIDSKAMQVLIERAKGKKDRYANLPESILEQLRKYFIAYQPKEYLFEGQYGGPYSARSAQQVFKDALQKAGINKSVSFHSLRHSYATHLLENGTDIRFIKELLGHNDIKTTLIYTNVSDKSLKNIKSPLDNLDL